MTKIAVLGSNSFTEATLLHIAWTVVTLLQV